MMPAKKKTTTAKAKEKALRKAIGRVYDPRTGAPVKATLKAVRDLSKSIDRDYKAAVRLRNKAARKRFGGAKTIAKQREYNRDFLNAARAAARLGLKRDKALNQLREAERAAEELKTRRGAPLPKVLEIGISYIAEKGPASNVNFNIRIQHKNNRGLTDADALLVLTAIANNEKMPSGLKVWTIDWASPSRIKAGTLYERRNQAAENATNFASVIQTILQNGDEFRIGEVKPDDISGDYEAEIIGL